MISFASLSLIGGDSRHIVKSSDRVLESLCKADDVCDVFGAAASAAFLTAAVDEVCDPYSGSYVQDTDTLGSVDLVTGERKHIDTEVGDVDRDISDRLDCVGEEGDLMRLCDLCEFLYRKHRADFVVGEHRCDEDGIGADRRLKLLRLYLTVGIDLEIGYLKTLFFQRVHCVKDCVMLVDGCDYMLAL